MPPQSLQASTALVGRLIGYAVTVAVVFEAVVVVAGAGTGVATEHGPIETLQSILALGAAALLLTAGARTVTAGAGFTVIGIACLFVFVRELDRFFDQLLWHGSWKLVAAPLVLWAVYVVVSLRGRLATELAAFARTTAFPLVFSGLLLIVVYGQIVGQKELWQAVMGEGYLRSVKDTVEETTELLGYLFMAFAAVEAWLHARGERRR